MTPGTAIADYLNGIRYHRYSRSVPIERRRLFGLAAVCGETAWLADRRVAVARSFRGEASIYYHAREDGTIAATEAQELAAAVDRFSVDLEPLAPLLALNQRCATADTGGPAPRRARAAGILRRRSPVLVGRLHPHGAVRGYPGTVAGTVDPSTMTRVTSSVGRCSHSDRAPAAWAGGVRGLAVSAVGHHPFSSGTHPRSFDERAGDGAEEADRSVREISIDSNLGTPMIFHRSLSFSRVRRSPGSQSSREWGGWKRPGSHAAGAPEGVEIMEEFTR